MKSRDLKNKPLVEAILEVRWALVQRSQDLSVDPHYKLLLGRLYERTREDYPEHEELPSAQMPDEISAHVVKHRFRRTKDGWPLIQVGPGVLTVNDTSGYTWTDFRTRSLAAVDRLFESHPKPEALKIDGVLLRYVDAVGFDYGAHSVFAFLRQKMRVETSLPEGLFEGGAVRNLPAHLSWQTSFECGEPKGMVHLRFATGHRHDEPALLWETMVQSLGRDVPEMPARFGKWLDAAHAVTHDWFFRLIEGDLERRFQGE